MSGDNNKKRRLSETQSKQEIQKHQNSAKKRKIDEQNDVFEEKNLIGHEFEFFDNQFQEDLESTLSVSEEGLQRLSTDELVHMATWLQMSDLHALIQVSKRFNDLCTSEVLIKQVLKNNRGMVPTEIDKSNSCPGAYHLFCILPDKDYIYHYWNQLMFNCKLVQTNADFLLKYQQLKLEKRTRRDVTLYWPTWNVFRQTNIMKTVHRILPFQFWMRQRLFDIHECMPVRRDLNYYEQQLFTHIRVRKLTNSFKITSDKKLRGVKLNINDWEEFEQKFEELYFFSKWRRLIDWKHFFIAGSSVLAALINQDWRTDCAHDVDIFAQGVDLPTFNKIILKMQARLFHHRYEFINQNTVKTFKFEFFGRQIVLQFIWFCQTTTKDVILNNFDMDACQCSFSPESLEVLVTGAFLGFLETGCMIPYCVIGDKDLFNIKTSGRIKKYVAKGFKHILIPKKMSVDFFSQSLNQPRRIILTAEDESYMRENYLFVNMVYDYYSIQKRFLNLLFDQDAEEEKSITANEEDSDIV